MGRPGPGAGGEPRDPALADFPERSPGTRRWTSADQPGPHLLDAPGRPVLPVESEAVSARRRFHRQEAHLVLSALRHRAAELGDRGDVHQVTTCAEAPDRHDEPLSACAPTTWSSRDHVLRHPGVQVLAARGSVSSQAGVARWAEGRGRRGEDACPSYTAGCWAFLERDRERLAGNRRMRRPLQGLDRSEDLPIVVEQEVARGTAAP